MSEVDDSAEEAPIRHVRHTKKELRAIRAAREALQDNLIALRRGGASFREIAKTLIDQATGEPYYSGPGPAFNAWNRAVIVRIIQPTEAARLAELDRLDSLQLAYWTKAISGDVKAAEMVLKVMQRRAKMEGFDQPERLDIILRSGAERIAQELGLNVEDVIADAQRILDSARG